MAVTTAAKTLNTLAQKLLGDDCAKVEFRQRPARGWYLEDERLGANESEATDALRAMAATPVQRFFPLALEVEQAVTRFCARDERPRSTVVGWHNDKLYIGWDWHGPQPDAERISEAVGHPVQIMRKNRTIFTVVSVS